MKGIIKSRFFMRRFCNNVIILNNNTTSIQQVEDCELLGLYVGKKKKNYGSDHSNLSSKEIDVFQECECEFDDSIPSMISSSSSSSSSSCSSPRSIEENCSDLPGFSPGKILDFEEKQVPGGNGKVVLYTTSLRGIRKTYEDCRTIKFLLESFRVVYFERDVSMDLEFRDELWRVLGKKSTPPMLFIKGRHIGGAEEVSTLNECGILKVLLEGIPLVGLGESSVKCRQCGGVGFLLCLDCHGSCKIYNKGGDHKIGGSLFSRCPKCNENGLIKCPTCSC